MTSPSTPNKSIENYLAQALQDNSLNLNAAIQGKLLLFLELIRKWNKVFNLTAVLDPEQMVWRHLVDSLVIGPYLHGEKIIDIGTGAGLPGIPLALMYPQKQFVLLDSQVKKTRFLLQAVLELGLKNVSVIHERCEKFHPPEVFDSILSRAFAAIPLMLEQTQHLAGPHSQFLAMKGTYPEQELREMPDGFKLLATHKLIIHGLNAERHLICIAKA